MPSRNAESWFGTIVIVYIDNVIWGTDELDDHESLLRQVLIIANSKNLRFKPTAFDIAHTQLHILGHLVTQHGIEIDSKRLDDIKKWEPPMTGKDMYTKLGKLGFLRDHIRNYAELSAPFEKMKQTATIE